MIELKISSIPEFLSRPLWDTKTMIFRGVPRSIYGLEPSIARVSAQTDEARYAYEEQLLEDFQERAFPHLRNEPKNSLEWLTLAQHYGIPTRLLDWTSNPLVALFFAIEKDDEFDGAIYKLIQSRWITGAEDAFDITEEFGIRPKHTDIRFINQAGAFTIHPTHSVQFPTEHIAKYIVPSEKKADFRWELAKYGIRPSFIYPGLDGLARDIIEENRSLLNGGLVRMNFNAPFTA
jgi:hypothetical protein